MVVVVEMAVGSMVADNSRFGEGVVEAGTPGRRDVRFEPGIGGRGIEGGARGGSAVGR